MRSLLADFVLYMYTDDMLLIGTIHRRELHRAVDNALSLENKLVYFSRKLGLSVSIDSAGVAKDYHRSVDQSQQQDIQQVRQTTHIQ